MRYIVLIESLLALVFLWIVQMVMLGLNICRATLAIISALLGRIGEELVFAQEVLDGVAYPKPAVADTYAALTAAPQPAKQAARAPLTLANRPMSETGIEGDGEDG